MWLELRRQGVRCGRKRIERIMRENGLVDAHLRKGWKSGSTRQDFNHTTAPDLINREFHRPGPNQLWVADLAFGAEPALIAATGALSSRLSIGEGVPLASSLRVQLGLRLASVVDMLALHWDELPDRVRADVPADGR
jgi:hypothetical protein